MNTDTPIEEVYISVDVETAGPNPADYSLLTIGACTIAEPQQTFYVELRPVNPKFVPEALAVSRLSMERLFERGAPPNKAMEQFETWIKEQVQEGEQPILIAFNAPFDWMFLNDYFHHHLGRNPFGHTAIDIKSFYMGLTGVRWQQTAMQHVGPRYLGDQQLTHHALRDAMDQAVIFRKMLAETGRA
jgi:DNA polymerase III epsilon subunit-like protein